MKSALTLHSKHSDKLGSPSQFFESLEKRFLLSAAVHRLSFKRVNFESDSATVAAAKHDSQLLNPWGLAAGPSTEWWTANNGSGVATLFNGDGALDSMVVTIPPPTGKSGSSAPSGEVFNSTSGFQVGPSWPAEFIFSTEDGTISGWSPLQGNNTAVRMVDQSGSGSVFKGLAIGTVGSNTFIYATDFHNNKVDVFDSNFQPATLAGTFHDKKIPAGYAPFGIQNIDGLIYVTYANQDVAAHDPVPGHGHGFVDIFNADGVLMQRLARKGLLNSPWGLAKAPASWGRFKHDLLVGNFDDGFIQILNPTTGAFISYLRNSRGSRIHTSGLWALEFGNDALAGSSRDLFFTAGPNSESNGLFGKFSIVHPTVATATPALPPPVAPPAMGMGGPGNMPPPMTLPDPLGPPMDPLS